MSHIDRRAKIEMTADFSLETVWVKTLKYWTKKKKSPLRTLYPANMSFKNKGKVKTISDIQKLKKFIISWSELSGVLKQVLQAEGKWLQIEKEIKTTKNGNG